MTNRNTRSKNILLITLMVTAILSGSVLCGYLFFGSASADPVTVTKTVAVTYPAKTVYIDREIVREVDVMTTQIVEVEVPAVKIIEISKQYKDWQSVEQFKEWYGSQHFTTLMPNGGDLETADCDDYASWVARTALSDGYLVSLALVDGTGRIYETAIGKPYHMGNLITVGNGVYYVEPYCNEFKVLWVTDLDSVDSYEYWNTGASSASVRGSFTIGEAND